MDVTFSQFSGGSDMAARQIPERVFLCLVIFLIVAFSATNYDLQRVGIAVLGVWAAHLARAVLVILAALALLDTCINDMLPSRFSISIKLQHRQLIWMFLACTLIGLAYVHYRVGRDIWNGVWLTVFGARCASIAFLDLKYEIDERKKG